MVISTSAFSTPVGAIKSWIRPDGTTTLPYGWLICDGSVVSDSSSPFNGKTLPILNSKFLRGHPTLDNSNFGSDSAYFMGGTVPSGGADSRSLGHTHTVNSHTHGYAFTTTTEPDYGQGPVFSGSPITSSHNHSISGTTLGTVGSTLSSLGASENRPAFVQTLTIIRIK